MIALKITNIRNFMSKLLMKELFDQFYISEATISTYNTFQINGELNKDFYTSEELELLGPMKYSRWEKVRPYCFELIKGNKTTSYFKFIFLLPEESLSKLIEENHLDYTLADINGLFVNIKFSEGVLTCVTGSSIRVFTMDKSLDHAFDTSIKQFLSKNSVDFEEL
jgi:hypothetical protein